MSKGSWDLEKRIKILGNRLSQHTLQNKERDERLRDLEERVSNLEREIFLKKEIK